MGKNIDKIKRARAILHALPRLETRIDAECKYTNRLAQNSWNGYEETLSVMQRVIDHTYKIWQMHNLKVRAERIIEYAPKKIRRVIEYTFIDGFDITTLAHKMKTSERTASRLLNKAVQYFADTMPKSMTAREIKNTFN